jgi:hypothetical protein
MCVQDKRSENRHGLLEPGVATSVHVRIHRAKESGCGPQPRDFRKNAYAHCDILPETEPSSSFSP